MSITLEIAYSIVEYLFIGLLILIVCLVAVYIYSVILTGAEGKNRAGMEDEELNTYYNITLKPRGLISIITPNNIKSRYRKTRVVLRLHNILVMLFWIYVFGFIILFFGLSYLGYAR